LEEEEERKETAKKASGEAFMEPFVDPNSVDSNCMWLVEAKASEVGGKLVYSDEQYYLRHLNSHRYLSVSAASKWKKAGHLIATLQGNRSKTRDAGADYKFVSVVGNASGAALFTFHSAHNRTHSGGGDNSIHDMSAILVESSVSRWLYRGRRIDNSDTFTVMGIPKKAESLALIMNRVDEASSRDIFFGVDALPKLVDFKNFLVHKDFEGIDEDMEMVETVLEILIKFCIVLDDGEELTYGTVDLGHLSSNTKEVEAIKEIVQRRQKLFREQCILDVCMQMLEGMTGIQTAVNGVGHTKDQKKIVEKAVSTIGKCCFWLVYCATFENSKNQMHIAEDLAVVLAHVSTSTLATKLIRMLLGTNMELQEEKVDEKEVKIFVDLIRESKMNCNYVNLLRATCNCNGEGVDGNQGLVADLFMTESKDLTIQFEYDWVERKQCDWKAFDVYGSDSSTLGFNVKDKGIPVIKVFWSEIFKDFSPLLLYGKSSVPIKEVVAILADEDLLRQVRKTGGTAAELLEESQKAQKGGGNGIMSPSNKRASAMSRKTMGQSARGSAVGFNKGNTRSTIALSGGGDISVIQLRKLMVAEYFVSQIYLYAETCLDRNYISMQLLEEIVPYDILLCLVRDATLPDEFKAAVTRLLNCLYLDAYPQSMVRLPTLTRVWSRIDPSVTPLPTVEIEREKHFAFLQEGITEHLESLVAGARWTVFTRRQMESLMLLVKFRFYNTAEQIQQVVEPLLKTLDRRSAALTTDDDEGGGKRMSLIKGASATISPENDAPPMPAKVKWQAPMLKTMNGVRAMVAVLGLVFLAILVSAIQMASETEDSISEELNQAWYENPYVVFEYFTTIVFTAELLLRMHCFYVVKGGIMKFFNDRFHNLDIFVVLLDLGLLILQSQVGKDPKAGLAKSLRGLRILRLGRLLKAARLVNELQKPVDTIYPKWNLAKRYRKTPEDQLSTMVEMVRALDEITRLSHDYNVSKLLNNFKLWHKGENKQTPSELFDHVIDSSKELELDSTGILEEIFLDLCYYDYPELVQNSLQVLMVHHSTRQILLENINEVQLLTTTSQEDLHDKLKQKLMVLDKHAEQSELWVEFENEGDDDICEEVQSILAELADYCKTDTENLDKDGGDAPDKEIQDILRNLGAFEVAATVLELAGELDDDDDDDDDDDGSSAGGDDGSEDGSKAEKPEEESGDEGQTSSRFKKPAADDGDDDGSKAKNPRDKTKNEKVHDILLLCNTFLTWFVRDNEANQELAFQNLDLLQETIDEGIDSTRVIAQIFRKNEKLMKLFPESLVGVFANKIAMQGKNPDYLDLLESIVSFADYNQISHQYMIIQEFTSTTRADQILYLCQEPGTVEYEERKTMMSVCRGDINPEEVEIAEGMDPLHHESLYGKAAGEMPPLLKYHIKLLNIMAGCAVGRTNITTVEAKLQSMYSYDHVLKGISDPSTCIEVKVALANLFFEGYIEVEISIPGLSNAREVWEVFGIFPDFAREMAGCLVDMSQSLEYMRKLMYFVELGSTIVEGFIDRYYTGDEFRGDNEGKNRAGSGDGDHMSDLKEEKKGEEEEDKEEEGLHWIDKLMVDLYSSYKELYDLRSPMLTDEQNTHVYKLLDSLTLACDALQGADLPIHVDALLKKDDDDDDDGASSGAKADEVSSLRKFCKILTNDEELQEKVQADRMDAIVRLLDDMPRLDDDVQAEVRYEPTIRKLVTHTRNLIQKDKNKKFIPRECEETAIWTIQLFRAMIEDKWKSAYGKPMDINERDEEGGEEEDEAAKPVQDCLDDCGATILCLDVIADGMNQSVVEEGVNLLCCLLIREGGNKKVQQTIFDFLNQKGTDHFFEEIRNRLKSMIEWHQLREVEKEDAARDRLHHEASATGEGKDEEDFEPGDEVKAYKRIKYRKGAWSNEPVGATITNKNDDGTYDVEYDDGKDGSVGKKIPADKIEGEEDDVDQPEGIILIRAIQLMSEGHFDDNQNICREQPNNIRSFNLLDDFVNYLGVVSKIPCNESTEAGSAVADCILEVIQGPCVKNQQHLALNTELIEILNRMMRSKGGEDADEEAEESLKCCGLEIFEALLEGQGKGSGIYERILSVIHLDVLQVMACAGAGGDDQGDASDDDDNADDEEKDDEEEEEEDEEGMGDVQTEALVLMQMLCDYKPELRNEIEYPPEIKELIGKDVVSVEVVWNGALQRRFFPIPEMCHDLAGASKDKFVEGVDRDSQETKLQGLMSEAQVLHIEIKHQQVLKELGVSRLFSRNNQEMATWIGFSFACLINIMLLAGYHYKDADLGKDADGNTINAGTLSMDSTMEIAVMIVNIGQCITSIFVLVLFLVVRCPVAYQVCIQRDEMNEWWAMYYAATDAYTLYYLGYVVVAALCINEQYLCCFLLLDIIVKDSTTRDVLNAVIYPIKQLTMTVILTLFVINIFQTLIFFFFHSDVSPDLLLDSCSDMFGCLKITLDYGMRLSGGIGDMLEYTTDRRLWIDLLYFVFVLVVLLNVVFGIIIDTFSELRQKKMERLSDTFGTCFICGQAKEIFDKAAASPHGFKEHIVNDHKMWNYVFFMIFIWEQDQDDDDGLELYVRNLIRDNDIQWFPLNQALTLVTESADVESIEQRIDRLGESFDDELTRQNEIVMKSTEKFFGNIEKQFKILNKRQDETFFQLKDFGKGTVAKGGGDGSVPGSAAGGPRGSGHDSSALSFSFIGRRVSTPEGMEGTVGPNASLGMDLNNNNNLPGGEQDAKARRTTQLMKPPPGSRYAKVAVLGAQDLAPAHLFGTSDPFVVAQVFWNDEKVGETDTIWMTQNPKWEQANNSFQCPLWSNESQNQKMGRLKVLLYHAHRRGLGHFLGQVEFNFEQLMSMKHGNASYYPLQRNNKSSKASQKMVQGEIRLAVAFTGKFSE